MQCSPVEEGLLKQLWDKACNSDTYQGPLHGRHFDMSQ